MRTMRRDLAGSADRSGLRVLRPRLRWALVLPTVVALLSAVLFATPASAGQTYSYSASWQGYPSSTLTLVPNVIVAGYPDARLVGQVTNFQTTSKKQSCLNGLSINVYTAPAEFPGAYVVNDDSQGAMCVLGTWTFPIYSYVASWLNYPPSSVTLIPNVCVECFGDSTLVGRISRPTTRISPASTGHRSTSGWRKTSSSANTSPTSSAGRCAPVIAAPGRSCQ